MLDAGADTDRKMILGGPGGTDRSYPLIQAVEAGAEVNHALNYRNHWGDPESVTRNRSRVIDRKNYSDHSSSDEVSSI